MASEFEIIKFRSDVVFYEAPQKYSIDRLLVPDGSTVGLGQVLGRRNASGEHVPLDPAASDGSEIADAVAVTEKSEAGGSAYVYGLRRHAIVNDSGLIWPESIDPAAKAIAVEQLRELGVVVQ